MKIFDTDFFFHKMLNYAFFKIQAQYARKCDAAVCFLFTVSYDERNNIAKSSLRESLHQINIILWFFGVNNVKTTAMRINLNFLSPKIWKIGYCCFQ